MLKPADPAAIAPLNPPGWSVSPANPYVGTDEIRLAPVQHLCSRSPPIIWRETTVASATVKRAPKVSA